MNTETQSPKPSRPLSPHMRLVLNLVGAVLVVVGIAGVILPLLPGVPLLIVAAACFARSSPRLEHWLVSHPVLGPGIIAWRERRAISTKAKFMALGMMTISGVFIVVSGAPAIFKALALASMAGIASFIATRPDH
jgi:uncharacterized protein